MVPSGAGGHLERYAQHMIYGYTETDLLTSFSRGGHQMSSAGERTKTDAERPRTHATPLTPSLAAAPTEPVAVGRTRSPRTTRRTVDLSPAEHRALDIWQREAADRLGLTRVTGQEVLTALIDQLLSDPRLSAQVTRTIHDRR
jgi:hypothetical protein